MRLSRLCGCSLNTAAFCFVLFCGFFRVVFVRIIRSFRAPTFLGASVTFCTSVCATGLRGKIWSARSTSVPTFFLNGVQSIGSLLLGSGLAIQSLIIGGAQAPIILSGNSDCLCAATASRFGVARPTLTSADVCVCICVR